MAERELLTKTFNVEFPFSGSVHLQVEAEDPEDAKIKGFEKACGSEMRIDIPESKEIYINEWQFHKKIVEGNVCHATCWEIHAYE
jgi:hypothetical protein